MNFISLKKKLQARGVVVRPPVQPAMLSSIERKLQRELTSEFKCLYCAFDGFEEADHRSQLKIWSVKEVLEELANKDAKYSKEYFAFGDFLIYSNFLIYPRGGQLGPVCMGHGQDIIAKNMQSFFDNLLSGQYDFLDE